MAGFKFTFSLLLLIPFIFLLTVGSPGDTHSVFLPIVENGAAGPQIAGCPVLPADNVWNAPIDRLPVDANSDRYIQHMSPNNSLHADFGTVWEGAPIGIPYVLVNGSQPEVNVNFDYAGESDPGPYPIPPDAPIEGGSSSSGDRHVLVIDKDRCKLYELYAAYHQSDNTWQAGSGAIYDLRSDHLRPATWTSADAAGLPIFPGLARYDEFSAGQILHALRFTAQTTRNAFIWPARHQASDETSQDYPPMGQRFRLKASFSTAGFSAQEMVFVKALKTYGLILADNGSNWYISGAPDSRWNDDQLHTLFDRMKGSDFEAVDESSLMVDVNSGQAR
jgi:hypothetical protein